MVTYGGAAQGDADVHVEGRDDDHGQDEEEEGGELEDVPHAGQPHRRDATL